MKQIKGELWPPGETLAGHRDEIQMVDSGRIIQQVWTPFKLSIKCIIISSSIITVVIMTNIITAWHHWLALSFNQAIEQNKDEKEERRRQS